MDHMCAGANCLTCVHRAGLHTRFEPLPSRIYETLYGEVCERYVELKRETDALQAELAEWRAGKRRVFWRGRYVASFSGQIEQSFCAKDAKKIARSCKRRKGGTVHRVTVGPAKPKEAK